MLALVRRRLRILPAWVCLRHPGIQFERPCSAILYACWDLGPGHHDPTGSHLSRTAGCAHLCWNDYRDWNNSDSISAVLLNCSNSNNAIIAIIACLLSTFIHSLPRSLHYCLVLWASQWQCVSLRKHYRSIFVLFIRIVPQWQVKVFKVRKKLDVFVLVKDSVHHDESQTGLSGGFPLVEDASKIRLLNVLSYKEEPQWRFLSNLFMTVSSERPILGPAHPQTSKKIP